MNNEDIDKRYQEIAEKWMNNTITDAEKAEFAEWYHKDQDNIVVVDPAFAATEKIQRDRILAKIHLDIQDKPVKLRKNSRILIWWAAAAIFLIIGVGGALLMVYKDQKDFKPVVYANDIKPGGNKAYLILNNGKRIALTDAANGELTKEAGVQISKTADGQLTYTILDQSASNAPAFNTIETPRGGQYHVLLPDGSSVWLNAESSITFPTKFSKLKARSVKLNGEAYFEVIHDKIKPFIVHTGTQDIKVLGTHFNVNAYSDEPVIETTLLEGSVQLNGSTMLKPGEQAVNNGSSIRVQQVDPEYAIAWKDGKFRFRNENIKDLMRKVSRWYDVDVVYEGTMEHQDFSGVVSRFDNVSQILNVLESTNTIHFKIEGRRITVMP